MAVVYNPSLSFTPNKDGTITIIGKQGADWIFKINVKDANGDPIDLTGYQVVGQIRKSYADTDKYSWTCTITNAQQGEVTISLSNTITSSIPAGDSLDSLDSQYVYDFEITDAGGTVIRAFQGKLYIDPEVTK